MRASSFSAAALVGVLVAACTSNPSFIFPSPVEGVPGIQDLGLIDLVDPATDNVLENVIFGEIGPTGNTALGGVTFEFVGTNGPVCIWVDPETAFWNQSVARSDRNRSYREPDNIYDDGDIDVYGGQSVFYTGSPGVEIGTFEIRYTDPLGETVPIDFIECSTFAGRGAPEACEFKQTTLGVRYTVVLDAWSIALDDNRLGYGLIAFKGDCTSLVLEAGAIGSLGPFGDDDPPNVQLPNAECLIRGESVVPQTDPAKLHGKKAQNRGLPAPTWIGDEVPTWPLSVAFEEAYCFTSTDDPQLGLFCRDERSRKANNDEECSWELDASIEGNGSRCYCGDPRNTPSGAPQ